MKKTIRPVSILRMIWLLIWVILIGASISAITLIIIDGEYDLISWITIVFSVPILLCSSFIFCSDFKKGVKFEEKSLKVSADTADKRGLLIKRFQYSLEVKYENIQRLYVVYSSNDSNDMPVKHVFVAMPYLVMDCKDGSKQAINVYYYNKRQKAELIDEIILRAKNVGNLILCVTGREMWG